MELITRTGDDYFRLLENLLPRGPAWSDSDPLLAGIAPTLADVEARAHDLVRETDPRQTVELIERWEACCGLPDSCSIPGTETLAQRQQRLDAKINVAGGITESFYLSVLDSLGYPSATITKYEGMGFVCTSPCTASLYSDEWNFVWQVNFTEETKISDMTCLSQCTESLRTWGDTTAECVINKLCPSHTIVLFSYPPEATRASY
ncbi:YmfQ family protein [Dryocola sp. LX212]